MLSKLCCGFGHTENSCVCSSISRGLILTSTQESQRPYLTPALDKIPSVSFRTLSRDSAVSEALME